MPTVSVLSLRPVRSLALLVSGGLLVAADSQPSEAPVDAQPVVSAQPQIQELWGAEGHYWDVVGRSGDRIEIQTAIGNVSVAASADQAAIAGTLTAILTTAAAHPRTVYPDMGGWSLDADAIAGWHLWRQRGEAYPGLIIMPDLILQAFEVDHTLAADIQRRQEQSISAARSAVADAIANWQQHASGSLALVDRQQALAAIGRTLQRATALAADDTIDITPRHARRILADGWLEQVSRDLGDDTELEALASAVTAAVADAIAMRPNGLTGYQSIADNRHLMIDYANAYDDAARLIQLPDLTAAVIQPPEPVYQSQAGEALSRHQTMVQVATDADLRLSEVLDADPIKAQLVSDDGVLLEWTAAAGLSVIGDWRAIAPDRGRHYHEAVVKGVMPPHLVLTTPQGHLRHLLVEGGQIDFPHAGRNTPPMIDQLAATMDTIPKLALYGEYAWEYVFDTPDPSLPALIGSNEYNADIHSTAAQSMATMVGGICRGDCDDLAEFYGAVLDRQDTHALIASLPGHAALVAARPLGLARDGGLGKSQGDRWSVVVLQTGNPLEFRGTTLPEALDATYRWFGDDTFDPAQVGVLLRFDDEPIRSGHILSWRIYAEPDYAAALIDIQRDWHYAAYGTAIDKTQAIIDAGDHDTANYRELSGLYRATGQWSLAADVHAEAIERTPAEDAFSRAWATLELIGFLTAAERFEEARTTTEAWLSEQLPQLGDLDAIGLQLGLNLLGSLGDTDELRDLRFRVAEQFLLEELGDRVRGTIGYLTGERFSQRGWDNASDWRWQLSAAYSSAVALLQEHTPAEIASTPLLIEMAELTADYATHVAPWMTDTEIEVVDGIFSAATHAYAMLGRENYLSLAFDLLESGEPIKLELSDDLRKRAPVFAQHLADLPWVVTSPEFYYNNLSYLFDDPEVPFDSDLAQRFLSHLPAARERAEQLGALTYGQRQTFVQTELLASIINQDRAALAAQFADLAASNDQWRRETAAQIIAMVASHTEPAWFAEILATWHTELDDRPSAMMIAWHCVLYEAPAAAVLAAEAAVSRYPDEPMYQREVAFLRAIAAAE